MNDYTCTFYRPEKTNVREFDNIVGKLENDLHRICTDKLSEMEIYYYVHSLIHNAKPLDNKPEMYFLGLADPRSMPSDARVEYFYTPTYISVAIIIKSIMLRPELWDENLELDFRDGAEFKKKLKEVLPCLMRGCTGRGFAGHGYGGLKGMLEVLKIFEGVGTSRFLEKYPDVSPDFTELYQNCFSIVEKKLEEDDVKNTWGEDYTDLANEVLQLRRSNMEEKDAI